MAKDGFLVLAQRLGEVGLQSTLEERILDGAGRGDLALQLQLAIGQQHRQFRPQQAAPLFQTLGYGRRVGEALDGPVQASGLLQVGHETCVRLELAHGVHLQQRERQGLVVVVD